MILPNVSDDFAAKSSLAGSLVSHHALAGGDNSDPQATQYARQLVFLGVNPEAGFGDTFNAGNNMFLVRTIFQKYADHILMLSGNDFEIFDETFVLQNLCNGSLDFGSGEFNFIVMNRVCITDARKHIGNRISHSHLRISSFLNLRSYQLAFLTPGIAPS